jgi:hypothetical protein
MAKRTQRDETCKNDGSADYVVADPQFGIARVIRVECVPLAKSESMEHTLSAATIAKNHQKKALGVVIKEHRGRVFSFPIHAIHERGHAPGRAGRWLLDDLARRLAATAAAALEPRDAPASAMISRRRRRDR